MSTKVNIGDMASAVQKDLDQYAKVTAESIKKAVEKTAKEAVKELKSSSPKKTGRYAKSWRQKRERISSSGEEIVVYAGVYQLTHLLENGHAKRGGGRVDGIPHIKPVEEKSVKRLEEEIRKGAEHG